MGLEAVYKTTATGDFKRQTDPLPGVPIDPAGPQATDKAYIVPPFSQKLEQFGADDKVAGRVWVAEGFKRHVEGDAQDCSRLP